MYARVRQEETHTHMSQKDMHVCTHERKRHAYTGNACLHARARAGQKDMHTNMSQKTIKRYACINAPASASERAKRERMGRGGERGSERARTSKIERCKNGTTNSRKARR